MPTFNRLGPAARQLFHDLIHDPNLVGLWVMNEAGGGTILDRCTLNRLDGTVTGNPAYSKAIGSGFYGLDFDGTGDTVNLGHVEALNFERTDTFSTVTIVNPNISAEGEIIGQYDSLVDLPGWVFGMNASRQIFLRLSSAAGNVLEVRGGTALTNGTAYQVGFSYAATSAPADIILYVNGAAETPTTVSNTLSASIVTPAGVLARIGANSSQTADEFNGDIGILAVFNAVKTAADFRRWAFLSRSL